MSAPTDQVRRLCDEFGIRIIDKHLYPKLGETRAVATIARIIQKRGEPHARIVLSLLAESQGNGGLVDEASLWAISDLVLACADIVERRLSDIFDLMDGVPLGPYMAIASELRGFVPQRYALGGMIYLHFRRLRDSSVTYRRADPAKQRKAKESEHEKGRLPGYRKQPKRTIEQKVELGRELLAKKTELGGLQSLLRWAVIEKDLPPSTASYCMRVAREADAVKEASA